MGYYSIDDEPQLIVKNLLCVSTFDDGKAMVSPKDGNVEIIDEDGNVLKELSEVDGSPVIFSTPLYKGQAIIRTTSGWGVIDNKGNIIIKPDYYRLTRNNIPDYIGIPNGKADGFIETENATDFEIIDKDGKTIYSNNSGLAVNPSSFYGNGLIVNDKNEQYGVIDDNGKQLMKMQPNIIWQIGKDRAVFCKSFAFGLMDFDKNILLRAQYNGLTLTDDDKVIATKYDAAGNNAYILIDNDGKKVIDKDYSNLLDLGNGYYAALDYKGKWFIIENGKVTPFPYKNIDVRYADTFIENDKYDFTSIYLPKGYSAKSKYIVLNKYPFSNAYSLKAGLIDDGFGIVDEKEDEFGKSRFIMSNNFEKIGLEPDSTSLNGGNIVHLQMDIPPHIGSKIMSKIGRKHPENIIDIFGSPWINIDYGEDYGEEYEKYFGEQ